MPSRFKPQRLFAALIFLERYGFSFYFLYCALNRWNELLPTMGWEHEMIRHFSLLEIFRQIVWIQFDAFTGVMLLVGRKVTTPPQSLTDVLIPVVASFFYVMYELLPRVSDLWRANLWPLLWQPAFMELGLALNLIGLTIALWAALSLGRSFGVFAEVKQVVLHGAYRWVRHPIYFGYVFLLSGWAIGHGSLTFLLLPPLHMGILIYRAKLEERQLAASSRAYRDYQMKTGFIIPNFFNPKHLWERMRGLAELVAGR
ncbi:MAG TPA: isoprenylcysteine carboxylmethyltransferase family protein [Verrucomicrobiae bacterium]